jgi:hypothetical protein
MPIPAFATPFGVRWPELFFLHISWKRKRETPSRADSRGFATVFFQVRHFFLADWAVAFIIV